MSSVILPPLPDPRDLRDWCRETAAVERLQPWTVEKDLFLSRLIWGLAQVHGENLLLKGGTCLSKVDLGYHRMSEDVDLTIPGVPAGYRSLNFNRMNRVVQTVQDKGPEIGVALINFEGDRSEQGAHAIWEARYLSSFLPESSAVITIEVSIGPIHRPARRPPLRTLVPTHLAPGYADANCWALDFDEVRAEKVRAAFTRDEPQIRDSYDLWLLVQSGADMESESFRRLVDDKLEELGASPLIAQPGAFGLDQTRRRILEQSRSALESLVRADEPPLNLQAVLDHYDRIWGKT